MPLVGFELTIAAFERAKTVHALDRAATVTGSVNNTKKQMLRFTYCHVYQWLKAGFGLVIGFIDHLQVVTTRKYNTAIDFHTINQSTLLFSVYFH
jgi:hypothetical protein